MTDRGLPAVRLMGLLAVLWVLFYLVWAGLPYIRPGAAVIYAAREKQERDGHVFPPQVPVSSRLAIFGNSKVLTGFIPSLFDSRIAAESGIPLYSANLGKPDQPRYLMDLDTLARRGQLPRRVLITLPWAADDASTASLNFLRNDTAALDAMFPFRKLPRDLALFGWMAPRRGGFTAFYRYGAQAVRSMESNRGWYFIEGQSHYPGDRLPDGFRLATDRPDLVDEPAFMPQGAEFTRLNGLAERYGMQMYIVPGYHRVGELAPSPEWAGGVAARMKGFPRFTVAGPNYFLFENRFFSDPVHLNPEGARLYTRKLAEILHPVL